MASLPEIIDDIRRNPSRHTRRFIFLILLLAIGAGIAGNFDGCEVDVPGGLGKEREEAVLGRAGEVTPTATASGGNCPTEGIWLNCSYTHARTRARVATCLQIPRIRLADRSGGLELRQRCIDARTLGTVACNSPFVFPQPIAEGNYCAYGAPWADYMTELSCERVETSCLRP